MLADCLTTFHNNLIVKQILANTLAGICLFFHFSNTYCPNDAFFRTTSLRIAGSLWAAAKRVKSISFLKVNNLHFYPGGPQTLQLVWDNLQACSRVGRW